MINLIIRAITEFQVLTDLNTSTQPSQSAKSHKELTMIFDHNEIKSINRFLDITKKCRLICGKFNHSTKMIGLLYEPQKSRSKAILNVIQEIKTKWNSTENNQKINTKSDSSRHKLSEFY